MRCDHRQYKKGKLRRCKCREWIQRYVDKEGRALDLCVDHMSTTPESFDRLWSMSSKKTVEKPEPAFRPSSMSLEEHESFA